jgi:hypothetical protein
MQFNTPFVLAFIAATSAPSLAAPIPQSSTEVEHTHHHHRHHRQHNRHQHVARSPMPGGKAAGVAPSSPKAPTPKGHPTAPASGKKDSGAQGKHVGTKHSRRGLTLDMQALEERDDGMEYLELEARSPGAADKKPAPPPKDARPPSPVHKSRAGHRRSFDFEDFQELEARSPVPGAPRGPVSPAKPAAAKEEKKEQPKPKKNQRRSLMLEPRSPVPGAPRGPVSPAKPAAAAKEEKKEQPKPKKNQRRSLVLEARSPGSGTPKEMKPYSPVHKPKLGHRSFDFDDFQELEARSPLPGGTVKSSVKSVTNAGNNLVKGGKLGHRRSLDFDDFEELEARSELEIDELD